MYGPKEETLVLVTVNTVKGTKRYSFTGSPNQHPIEIATIGLKMIGIKPESLFVKDLHIQAMNVNLN